MSEIGPEDVAQADLFGEYSLVAEARKASVMAIVDLLNDWHGPGTLFFAAQGVQRE